MTKGKYQFERLTPTDDVNLDVYDDAINYVFDSPDIKNVAISGAYSAGKSSVLASYKKKHSKLRFLHISLAHFKSLEQENEEKVKESVLEGKILNQLLHQIPAKRIPQTNFKIKKNVGLKSFILFTVKVVLFFIATLHFTYFKSWNNYINILPDNWLKNILKLSTNQYSLMVDGLLMVLLLSFMVYRLISIQKNKNVFRKLNLQGNEIEIFEESNDSYFDKYLNEVLYLFENSDADVIVFEDMDRFNANEIFERLHEVNTLANIQLQKDSKKILRFFYLLRDDIFISKDRTKFFDYIIPIVPVVDGSNSYDQLISHLKVDKILDKFSSSFLQGLSLYIDDMRLLKNICNEFVIYYNRLNTTELDCNKMFAIIAYKNLFPRDFAELQLNQGFVYTLFYSKDRFIAKEIQTLNERISKKDHEIELAKNEHLKSIAELDVVFDNKRPTNYYGRRPDLSQEDQNEYSERKKAIEDKLSDKIPVIENEKLRLEEKIVSIQNEQLSEIITRDNIDSIFGIKSENEIGKVRNFHEIKSSEYFDLLKYLIRNGYIDETYADYMTYFYENSLSRIDKTFLRSVTDKKAKEYTYKLKDPKLVVSRLRVVDFDQEETLNFDLFTYLLKNDCNEYIYRLIDQLNKTKNFKFIGGYFDITAEMSSYIRYLNIRWPEVFITALNEQLLTENQIRKYSINTLYYSDDEAIKSVNKDKCLSLYISNARDYLSIDDPNVDKLIHCFILLGVRFTGFEYDVINKSLFQAVYQNSLYKINVENLKTIQTEVLNVRNEKEFLHKNYTVLHSNLKSEIAQYVNQNINEYFAVILKICRGMICDDENVVIEVLNNPDLSREHKESYIAVLKTVIISINLITDITLWPLLLDADIVYYSEKNIMDCFESIHISKSVISYINRCDIDFDFSKTEYDESSKEDLFNSIVKCNDIENGKYKQILESLNFFYNNFDIAEISDQKIIILIDTSIIKMTSDNLTFMRENYPDQSFHFILMNIDNYIDIMNDSLFSEEELLEILGRSIGDELKLKLLEFSRQAISIVGKNYSPAVSSYILENNLMESELMDLFSSFEDWDNSVQEKIFDLALIHIQDIIDTPNSVSDKLKNSLLHSKKVSKDDKIELLVVIMPSLNENTIKEKLTLLNLNEYLDIFDIHRRPKFEINEINEKLLSALKENHFISDYVVAKNPGYYKVVRFK